jgi:hypothetical protein
MRNTLIALCLFTLAASAQTSNVQTVKAWKRTHVIGIPGGGLLDPTGTIADGQRSAAAAAMIAESSNIVAAAGQGLTNALERLWDAADHTNDFTGRLYLAADMDDDPDYENIEAYVVAESVDADGLIHYYTHYTRMLETAPKTMWAFEPAAGVTYWAPGSIDTNAPLTNILGYACYDITVERPQQVGNIILRTNKFLKWGTPETPLDISDAGLEIISGGETNRPFTGSVTTTNFPHEITEVYLSGFLHHITTKEAEWVNPYVTDGLVAMWDGEKSVDNRDIIKRLKLTLGSKTSYTNNYWYSSVKDYTSGAIAPIDTYNSINSGTFTIEMPYYIIDSYQAAYTLVAIRSGISNLVYVNTSGFNNDVTAASWINLGPGYHFISYLPQNPNDYQSSTVTLTVSNTLVRAFVSGVYKVSNTLGNTITTADSIGMGGAKMRIYGLRIYNRILTSTEIAHNYAIDKARFGL